MRVLFVTLLWGLLTTASAAAAELDVWAFNLRYASTANPNSWEARRPVVKSLLGSAKPDIIGTQEGLYRQVQDLDTDLPDYDWIGTGREGGSRGEFMAIFYRRDRFEPIAFDHLWLSDTPRVVGSKSWGNHVVRMVTRVEFRDRRDGTHFIVVNTHFDHQSENSRVKSAQALAALLGTFDPERPILITGDFNAADKTSAAYRTLVKDDIVDTWTAAKTKSDVYATYHGYKGPKKDGARIDWVLARGIASVEEAKIHIDSVDGQFPSDHFPVSAKVRLKAPPSEKNH